MNQMIYSSFLLFINWQKSQKGKVDSMSNLLSIHSITPQKVLLCKSKPKEILSKK